VRRWWRFTRPNREHVLISIAAGASALIVIGLLAWMGPDIPRPPAGAFTAEGNETSVPDIGIDPDALKQSKIDSTKAERSDQAGKVGNPSPILLSSYGGGPSRVGGEVPPSGTEP
jgi:hypothetical protein